MSVENTIYGLGTLSVLLPIYASTIRKHYRTFDLLRIYVLLGASYALSLRTFLNPYIPIEQRVYLLLFPILDTLALFLQDSS